MNIDARKLLDRCEAKWMTATEAQKDRISLFVFVIVLTLISIALYARFIFSDAFFIFAGSASDSIGQTVPFVLNEASRLESGDVSGWNQFQFLGSTTIQFLNPDYFPSILGASAVPGMMLVSQILKIVLAGVFFYLYLGYLFISRKTRFIVALGYAFCGRMIELAPWTAYTIEITFASGILWGFERFLNNNKKILVLPVMLAGVGMSLGLYGLVLYTLILLMYSIFRIGYIWDVSWSPLKVLKIVGKLLFIIAAAIAISMPVTLPSILSYANSARVNSDLMVSLSPLSFLLPSSLQIVAEIIVKIFSTGILGHMNSYRGSLNILNSPYFYCGLLSISAVPFAYKNKSKQQRRWLMFISIAALFYLYSIGFRYLLNGFSVSGNDFRQSSFWIVLVIGVLGSYGLDFLWSTKNPIPFLKSSAVTLLIFLGACGILGSACSKIHIVLVASLLVSYAALFTLLAVKKSKRDVFHDRLTCRFIIVVIISIATLEAITQNYTVIKNSGYLTQQEYEAQLGNDPEDAVLATSNDPEDTYRIDYKTLLLTRSMANTYLGTQSYIGGAGFNQQITDFLSSIGNDYVDQLGYTRYVYGFHEEALNSLLGVRYLVYPNNGIPYYAPFGYSKVNETDAFIVYENQYALPLLYAYGDDETAEKEDLELVGRSNRDIFMMDNVVLDSENARQLHQEDNTTIIDYSNISGNLVAKTSESVEPENPIQLSLLETNSPWIVLSAELSCEATASGCIEIYVELFDQDDNLMCVVPYLTAAGNEMISIPIRNEGFSSARISFSHINSCPNPKLQNIELHGCDESIFEDFIGAYEDRNANSADIHSYHNGTINATIEVESDGILASSIPFDSNLRFIIDGKEEECFPVNIGFAGCNINKGKHDIKLVYNDTGSHIAIVVCFSALAILMAIETASALQKYDKADIN